MKKKLVKIALSFSLVSASFAGTSLYNGEQVEAASTKTYQVTASSLNIRAGAGSNYKLLGSLKKGTKITVTGQAKNGWYQFTYKGKKAFVSNKYVKKVATTVTKTTVATAASTKPATTAKPATTQSTTAKYKYIVTVSSLNVRAGAGTKYKSLGSVKKGNELTVKGVMKNGWYKINFKGKTGYVSNKYVKKTQVVNEKVVTLKVPYYSQYSAKAEMGCEASSLLQALHFKGYAKQYDLTTFIKDMPIDSTGNPHKGFGGTPYKVVKGVYQSIFPKPLANWGSQYGNVVDITGSSVSTLKKELDKGNPIVVFITMNYKAPVYHKYSWGTGINNAHVVTLSGYKNGYYHVTDPAKGKVWVKAKDFENAYNLKKYAVAVR